MIALTYSARFIHFRECKCSVNYGGKYFGTHIFLDLCLDVLILCLFLLFGIVLYVIATSDWSDWCVIDMKKRCFAEYLYRAKDALQTHSILVCFV